MSPGNVSDEEVAELVRRNAEGTSAYMRGDIRRSLTLIPHSDALTLMAPVGGEPRRGYDGSPEALEATARFSRMARLSWNLCSHTRLVTWSCSR